MYWNQTGAGLGRLARDISLLTGCDVEANEISIVMSAAAYQLLNKTKSIASDDPFGAIFLKPVTDEIAEVEEEDFVEKN